MTLEKPFLPKNVFLAHELFLRAFHLDQQGQREEAQAMYGVGFKSVNVSFSKNAEEI